jgi:hypothetical protein
MSEYDIPPLSKYDNAEPVSRLAGDHYFSNARKGE